MRGLAAGGRLTAPLSDASPRFEVPPVAAEPTWWRRTRRVSPRSSRRERQHTHSVRGSRGSPPWHSLSLRVQPSPVVSSHIARAYRTWRGPPTCDSCCDSLTLRLRLFEDDGNDGFEMDALNVTHMMAAEAAAADAAAGGEWV